MSVLLSPRLWGAHLLALAAIVATLFLGQWQLESWQAQREVEAADLTGLEPVPLADVLGPDDPFPGDKVGQPVVVEGTWVPAATVYVAGREHEGTEGYWVVTPLDIDGVGGSALPIVRGWTPSVEDAPAPPQGTARMVVWLQPGEGTGEVDQDRTDRVIPQVRLADLIQYVDQDLYGGYGIVADEVAPGDWPVGERATNDGTGDMPAAELDQLPKTEGTSGLRNFLYGIEWYLFAAFFAFVWWRWARSEVQLQRELEEELADPDGDAAGDSADPAVAAATGPAGVATARRRLAPRRSNVGGVNRPLTVYRVMAYIVGVLLVVLCLIGVPLANFDGTGMWGIFSSTPAWVTPGSGLQELGEAITHNLGVAHGWLYMGFLISAFYLARQEGWEVGFTLVTLICGTIPGVSFWAEHRAVKRVRADEAADLEAERAAAAAGSPQA